ncbi:MAG: MBL fold metallo-hydrolase [Thermomicrobiales bacterium]
MASDTGWEISDGLWQIDLRPKGTAQVISAYLLAAGGEVVLIETGPTTTLATLRAGMAAAGFSPADLTTILVTHIHLDHSGGAGVLLREAPGARVYVHPVGAPHLIDPARLVASAGRIYGDHMEALWGEVAPVPADQVSALAEGETLSIAGRVMTALFTPGHASHHVVYWDASSGTAFTGDVGGVRIPGSEYVCAPMPPPELDPTAWDESIQRLRGLAARRLCLTHFGVFDDVEAHLDRLETSLQHFLELGETAYQEGAGQEALTGRVHARMAEAVGHERELEALELATPSFMAALGLLRWANKRER